PTRTFAEAAAKGYLIRKPDGSPVISHWWKGDGGLVDFTNPQAAAWWQEQVTQTLHWGTHAFKCDGGEGNFIPDGSLEGSSGDSRNDTAVFFDGTPAREMKNRFPTLYLKTMQDVVDQRLGCDGVLFARSGFTGTQTAPVGWAGDNEAGFSYEN